MPLVVQLFGVFCQCRRYSIIYTDAPSETFPDPPLPGPAGENTREHKVNHLGSVTNARLERVHQNTTQRAIATDTLVLIHEAERLRVPAGAAGRWNRAIGRKLGNQKLNT